MIKKAFIMLCYICSCIQYLSAGLSVVYNLRMSQTTRSQDFGACPKPTVFALTPFAQYRKKKTSLKEQFFGSTLTTIYSPQPWYIEADLAAGYGHKKDAIQSQSTAGIDDIVLYAGYSPQIDPQAKTTFSGIVGIPTKKDNGFRKLQIGVGHTALGGQIDAAYHCDNFCKKIMVAIRLLHFFPCTVQLPEYNCQGVSFSPGNALDLYVAYNSILFNDDHHIEFGYNPTFLTNTTTHPRIEKIIKNSHFIRNGFYGLYQHKLPICHVESNISLALSYGFDIKPRNGYINLISVWSNWGVNF